MPDQEADRAGTTSAPGRTHEPTPADGGASDQPDAAPPEPSADEKRLAELDDRWRRTAAELDNLRKRSALEAAQVRADERARVLNRWLPVIDNLELALEHADADADSVVAGVRAIRDQALALVAELGYPRFDDRGATFDPRLHEAIGTVATSDEKLGTVVQVLRSRYGDEGQVLRPAAVIVATEPR
jgi:molecular chaperone GrpE